MSASNGPSGPPGPLARLAATMGTKLGWHVAPAAEYHLLKRSYYAPLPEPAQLTDAVWQRRSAMRGIQLDTAQQLAWAQQHLAEYLKQPGFPRQRDPANPGYFLDNGGYESVDAELAYAMVRYLRPARVLELGSGFSTLAMATATAANHAEGTATVQDAYDPFPRDIHGPDDRYVNRHRTRAQDVPLTHFTTLTTNDILFVDTSHVVTIGGEVPFIVLEVLPVLQPGVVVHFHDIWLPGEYHRNLTEYLGHYWNEQYLLQAFLVGNPGYEILFATRAVVEQHAQAVKQLVPSFEPRYYPTSFWIRRTDAPL